MIPLFTTNMVCQSLNPRGKAVRIWLQLPVTVPLMVQPAVVHYDVLIPGRQVSLLHHHFSLGLDQVLAVVKILNFCIYLLHTFGRDGE